MDQRKRKNIIANMDGIYTMRMYLMGFHTGISHGLEVTGSRSLFPYRSALLRVIFLDFDVLSHANA